MKRGDLVTVALQGEQGKPRPALIVQSDNFAGLGSVTVLPITGTILDAPLLRIDVQPTPQNGLTKLSQVMIDKPQTPPLSKVGLVIGQAEDATMVAVNRALALFLDLA